MPDLTAFQRRGSAQVMQLGPPYPSGANCDNESAAASRRFGRRSEPAAPRPTATRAATYFAN